MPRIKIISIPSGREVKWVREAWVGLELETVETQDRTQNKVPNSPPQHVDGYKVFFAEAVDALKKVNPDAARWFTIRKLNRAGAVLVFARDVCEEV